MYTTFSVLLGTFSHLSHLLIPVFCCISQLTFHFVWGLHPEIHSPTTTVYSLLTFPYTCMVDLRLLHGKQVDQKTPWLKWTLIPILGSTRNFGSFITIHMFLNIFITFHKVFRIFSYYFFPDYSTSLYILYILNDCLSKCTCLNF